MRLQLKDNSVNFANREYLIAKEMLRRRDWYFKKWGRSSKDDCPCVIDTGCNGGDLCGFNWLVGYVGYW